MFLLEQIKKQKLYPDNTKFIIGNLLNCINIAPLSTENNIRGRKKKKKPKTLQGKFGRNLGLIGSVIYISREHCFIS